MKDRLPAIHHGKIGTERNFHERAIHLGIREQMAKEAMKPGTAKSVITAVQEALALRRRQGLETHRAWLDQTQDDSKYMP